jgi:hypothetical protein
MVYENNEAMEKVLGKLSENTFIKQEQKALDEFKASMQQLMRKFKAAPVK